MIRSQKKQLAFKGGITPFLSLIFLLVLSLAGAMIQSASIQTTKSIKRAEMSLALENLFAEYNVELLRNYDLFVRVGSNSYEIFERLKFYGVVDTQHKVLESTLLSDGKGAPFFKQAVESMGGKTETEKMTEISAETLEQKEENIIFSQLEGILQKEEKELPKENNPINIIQNLKNSSLLSLIYPNQEQLSNKNIKLEDLPSYRTLKKGEGDTVEKAKESVKNKVLFASYLMEHFQNAMEVSGQKTLAYEEEYLLGGKASDQENLTVVAEKLLAIRMAVNYTYLLTDKEKKLEAQVVAMGLSSLLTAPEAAELVKQGILVAWAYGESILDLRILLKGKKIPLIKTADTWQLQLSNMIQLTSGEAAGERNFEEGVTYEDYLRTLLIIEERETLCMRALDLIEANTGIRVDDCVVGLAIKSECRLRRNITYTFRTEYQYK